MAALPRPAAPEAAAQDALEEVAQPAAARAEELLEDVARIDAARLEAAAAQALVTELVVDAPLLGVAEDLVGLGRLLEAAPGVGVVLVAVGWCLSASLR